MARWSGWGATPQLFDTDRFADHRARLREILTDEEYAAARRSTVYAHYTDAALVSAIWDAARAFGFTGGTVLEPGCGSGHFIGLAPDSADMVGVEREPVSAGIAAALYPDAQIVTGSFADLSTPEGSFDLVIGNVPFGDVVIRSDERHNPNQHRIHNHFILKSLHLTRPGGLVMVLTSHHTMDALNPAARTEMAQLADLVGAVRLPTNAHRKAAGTDVVTDLLVLRRREPDATPRVPFDRTWERALPAAIGEYEMPINQYFADRPDLVLGRLAPGRSRLGRPALAVIGDPAAAPTQLATALERIANQARDHGLTWSPPSTPHAPRPVVAVGLVDPDVAAFRGFVTAHPDGTFTRRVGDADQPFAPPASQADELRALIGLRDTVMALLAAEQATIDDTEEIDDLRARLNADYDAYVVEYGPVCRFTERRQTRQAWHVFSEWCEQHDRTKAPAGPDTVQDYLTDLRHRGLGQDQLRRHLDGIAAGHKAALTRQVRKAVARLTKSLEQRVSDTELEQALTVLRQRVDSDPRGVVLATGQTPIEFAAVAAAAGEAVIATAAERTDPDLDLDAIGLRTTIIVRPPQGGFRGTPFAQRVRALEKFDPTTGTARKATVFRQRVINPPRTRLGADTPEEALSICLDTKSRVDLAVIARLLGLPDQEQARVALGELVYNDPATGDPIWARQYLSGNVRHKLATARTAAERDPAFAVNVAALEQVVPADLGPEDIEIRLGSWIGPEYVQQFLSDLLGDSRVQVERVAGLWAVSGNDRTVAATQLWGAGGLSVFDLTHRLLTGTEIKVMRTITVDGTDQSVLDPEATEMARDKAVEISNRFSDWVWDDTTRAAGLVRAYNDTFNAVVAPDFIGVELSLPGLSLAYVLKEHQLAAVARIIYQPATGLVHETGAGKTLEMIVGVMERRRRGLSTRPVVVVPNDSIAEQFELEWSQAYPGARLLAATSSELTGPSGVDLRRELVARIAQDDYDAVIMTKESFQRIPLQPEAMEAFLRRELDDLIAAKEAGRVSSATITKQLEAAIENTQEKLEKRLREIDRDVTGITFGDTGIDLVVIDEAQNYKNGMVHSSLPGLALDGADRSVDLDAKLAWLAQRHGESRVVLATATPWTNSLPEVYLWLRRLGHDLPAHDEWARTFATSETYMEMTAGGRLQPRTRFRRIINEPELWHMVRQTSDVKMRADLAHLVKVPPLRGGAVEILTAEAPAEARVFTLDLARRERNLGGKPEVGKDNALVVQHDGLLVALDVRTVGLHTQHPQKIDVLAEDIHHEWAAARDTVYLRDDGTEHPVRGGLILVFCDESTPGKGWNVYDQLKHHLIDLGLPEKAVRFIHEGSSPQRKADLLAACREGAVSVLVGSSMKMGAGLNVQTRVLGGYEVTAPWRPDVSVQAMGRAGRQGNQNPTWFWKRIVTAPSMDAKRWEVCKQKADMFAPLYSSQVPTRTRDLGDDHAPGLADVMAAATGDPRYLEKAELDQEHKSLTRRRAAHQRNQQALRLSVAENTTTIATLAERAARQEAVAPQWVSTRGDAFRMEINGRTYDKRVDAAEALKAFLVDKCSLLRIAERRTVSVGSLGGYAIAANLAGQKPDSTPLFLVFPEAPESTTSVMVRLDGFPTRHGIITRLENELDRIPGAATATREEIEQTERNLAQARSGLDAPFPHEDRLATVTQRRAQLLAELSATTDHLGDNHDPDSPEGKARAEQDARLADQHTAARDHALASGSGSASAARFASWYLAITTGVMPDHLPDLDVTYSVWHDLGTPGFDSGKRHNTPAPAMDRPLPAGPPVAADPAHMAEAADAVAPAAQPTTALPPTDAQPDVSEAHVAAPSMPRVSLRALRAAAADVGLSVSVERVGTQSFAVVYEPAVPEVPVLSTDAAGALLDAFGQHVSQDQVADWLRRYRAQVDATVFDLGTSVPDWARRTARLAPYGLAGPHHSHTIVDAVAAARPLVEAGGYDHEVEQLLRPAEAAATADQPSPARMAVLVRCIEDHAAGYHRAGGDTARYIIEHLHGTSAEHDWVTHYLAEHPHLLTTPNPTQQQRQDRDNADRAAGEQQARDAAEHAQAAHDAGRYSQALDLLDDAELAAPHQGSLFQHLRDLVRTAEAAAAPDGSSPVPGPPTPSARSRTRTRTTNRRTGGPAASSPGVDRERLLQLTQAAASWFEAEFDAENRRANQVREYLARRIGGPDKVEWARHRGFRLGYAPGQGWTDLIDHLRTQGFTDEDLIAAGVATRSSRGTLVDRFRQRLMFGIHDPDGHLAGFIGRTVSAGQEPKYLNSPASVLFDKGQLLFGWWEQRDLTSSADPLFVEGPFDVLAVAASDAAGLQMPIASCGTALTAAHLDVVDATIPLDRHRILALDGDTEGRKAALAHAETGIHRYPNLFVTTLPDGMDPAEWATTDTITDATGEADRMAIYRTAPHTRPALDVLIDDRVDRWSDRLEWAEGRLGAARDVARLLATLDPARTPEITARAVDIAARLEVDPAVMAEFIAAARHNHPTLATPPAPQPAPASSAADDQPPLPPESPHGAPDPSESEDTIPALETSPPGPSPEPHSGPPAAGPWSQRIVITETAAGVAVSGTAFTDPPELRQALNGHQFRWRRREQVWVYVARRSGISRDAAVAGLRAALTELDARDTQHEPADAATADAGLAYPPTAQQQAIIDACLVGQNVAVRALAGTGKTSTLRMVAARMPDKAITYIAFNRSIADEAQAVFGRNVTADTMHAFARQAMRSHPTYQAKGAHLAANDGFPAEIATALNLDPDGVTTYPGRDGAAQDIEVVRLVRLAQHAVARFRHSADPQVDRQHLTTDLATGSDGLGELVLDVARRIWADKATPDGTLRFTHDDYLKLWALTEPRLPGDVIVFDEAQDVNALQAAVVQAQPVQTIVVGDAYQSIYGFRGARDYLTDWPADVVLPLTQSWRFGPAVADLGNRFLSLLNATLELEGTDTLPSQVGPVPHPDAILCRTNAGAVAAVATGIEDGRRVALVGGGRPIQDIARAARDLQQGRSTRHPDLSMFASWQAVRDFVDEHDDAQSLRALVRLVDQHGPDGLIALVRQLTDETEQHPNRRAELVVSTAHKAKGREWNRVRIADDFRAPVEDSTTGQVHLPDPEELRLSYVTVTRAKLAIDLGSLSWILDHPHPSRPAAEAPAPVAAATVVQAPSAPQQVTPADEPATAPDVPAEPLNHEPADGVGHGDDGPADVADEVDIDAADDPLGDARPGAEPDHADIAAALHGLVGSQFVTVVRGLLVDARQPGLDPGFWSRRRPPHLPEPGVTENVRHDGKGVRIDISATQERRVGRLSWGQVFDWLRPGLTAARVQVLLAADTAHARCLAVEAHLHAASPDLADTVLARFDCWRGLAQISIVDAAWATHEGHDRASRRQRQRPDLRALTTDTDALTTTDHAALTRIANLAAALPDTGVQHQTADISPAEPDAPTVLRQVINTATDVWTGAEDNDTHPALLAVPEQIDPTNHGWTRVDIGFHHSGAVERWHRDDTELQLRWTNTEADLLLSTRLRIAHTEHAITSVDDLTTILTEAGQPGAARQPTTQRTLQPATPATPTTNPPAVAPTRTRKGRAPTGQLSLWDSSEPDLASTPTASHRPTVPVPPRTMLDHAIAVAHQAATVADSAGGHKPEAWLAFSKLIRSDPGTGIAYSAVEPEFAAVCTWWAQQAIDALAEDGYQVEVLPATGRRTRRDKPMVADEVTRTITVDAGLTSGLIAHYLIPHLADLRATTATQDAPGPPPLATPLLPHDRRPSTTGIDEQAQLTSQYLLADVARQLTDQPRLAPPAAAPTAAALPNEVRDRITQLARQADHLDAIADATQTCATAGATITGLGRQGLLTERAYRGFGVLADYPGPLTIACGPLRFRSHATSTGSVITIHTATPQAQVDEPADHVMVDPAWHQPEHTHRIQEAVLNHLSTARTRAHQHRQHIATLIADHTPAPTGPAHVVLVRHAPAGTVVDLGDLTVPARELVTAVLARYGFTAHTDLWTWPPVWEGARSARLEQVLADLAAADITVTVLDDLPDALIPPSAEPAIPAGEPFTTTAEYEAAEQAVRDAAHALTRLPAARRLLSTDRPDATAVSNALATVLAHPSGTGTGRDRHVLLFRALDELSAALRLEGIQAPVLRRHLAEVQTVVGLLIGRLDATPDLTALTPGTASADESAEAAVDSAVPAEPSVHLPATHTDLALSLRRQFGYQFADLIRHVMTSQPLRKPTMSGVHTTRRDHEPDAGASESVTTTARGIEIEVRTPTEVRSGRWTWKQITTWLRPGFDPVDVRVLLDASDAAFRFRLNTSGFLALGEQDLAAQAGRELNAMASAATDRILTRATEAHDDPAAQRPRRRSAPPPQPAADADLPPVHAAQVARIAALSAALPNHIETLVTLPELKVGDVLANRQLSDPVRIDDIVDHGDTLSLIGTQLSQRREDKPTAITLAKATAAGTPSTLRRINLPASLTTLVPERSSTADVGPAATDLTPDSRPTGSVDTTELADHNTTDPDSSEEHESLPLADPIDPAVDGSEQSLAGPNRGDLVQPPVAVDEVAQHWVALVASAAARGYRVQAAYTDESTIDHDDAVIHIAAGKPPLSRVVDLALKVGEIAVTTANITTTPAPAIEHPISAESEASTPVADHPSVDDPALEPPPPTLLPAPAAAERAVEPVLVPGRWDSDTPIFDELRHTYPTGAVPAPREPYPAVPIVEPIAAADTETPIFHELRHQLGLRLGTQPEPPLTSSHNWTDEPVPAGASRAVLPGSPPRTTFTALPPGSWSTGRGRNGA